MATSSTDMIEFQYFPPIVNFIWLGGEIPDNYLESILRLTNFLKKAPEVEFQVNLWVDNKDNLIKPLKKILKDNADLDENAAQFGGVHLRMIDEIQPILDQHPLFQEGANRNDMMWNIYRELIGSKNYAAASDLLRYVILLEGGYYFDTDTKFSWTKGAIPYRDQIGLGFLLNNELSVNREGEIFIKGGNDILVAVPNHPIIINTIKRCLETYNQFDKTRFENSDELFLQHAKLKRSETLSVMDAKRYTRNGKINPNMRELLMPRVLKMGLTLRASGPSILQQVILNYLIEQNIPHDKVPWLNAESQLLSMTITSCSDMTWLPRERPPLAKYDDTLPRNPFFKPKPSPAGKPSEDPAPEPDSDVKPPKT